MTATGSKKWNTLKINRVSELKTVPWTLLLKSVSGSKSIRFYGSGSSSTELIRIFFINLFHTAIYFEGTNFNVFNIVVLCGRIGSCFLCEILSFKFFPLKKGFSYYFFSLNLVKFLYFHLSNKFKMKGFLFIFFFIKK